jgi:hypothetical protein
MATLLKTSMRLEAPDHPSKMGWRFNIPLIERALVTTDINIQCFVSIRFTGGVYRKGTHRASARGYHRIAISGIYEMEEANVTLWHELRHAMQAERFSKGSGLPLNYFYQQYKMNKGGWGASYQENKYEIDAREWSEYWGEKINLLG